VPTSFKNEIPLVYNEFREIQSVNVLTISATEVNEIKRTGGSVQKRKESNGTEPSVLKAS